MYFAGRTSNTPEAAAYHPGVLEREKATPVEAAAGQTRSDLVFPIPKQKDYTVRGFISVDNKTGLDENAASVMLLDPDGRYWRSTRIDFRGALPLPRVKYFSFQNLPPGRYIAFAMVQGPGWFTRVVHVDVTTHAKLIFLELKHSGVP